jgi:hypothetical protein
MIDVSTLKVELGDISSFSCPCCKGESETVHGYLFDRTGETAVYLAGYTASHAPRRLNMVLSVGGWGEDPLPGEDVPRERIAIPLRADVSSEPASIDFVEPEDSPWFGEVFLGATLRAEELSDELRSLAGRLANFAISNDPRIGKYVYSGELSGSSGSADA